ncbi:MULTISPECIES: carboxypeptidase regulatory-like domain-containing protein [unclassified Anabaena]|uniref:carboxypeptidase regulatory-like domain-containing protein n=1 Tax=unclassified Anabaena TaxID=2619674 RepID=UPI0008343DA5|nr:MULTISPECIES: carboxypeptidase regulatory-like domain-containing protein [unclassified Anabaena]
MPSVVIEEIRHRVAIAGSVTNAVTRQGIPDIQVTVTELNLRTQTREDGSFYLLDLPVGQYELVISGSQLGKYYGTSEPIAVRVADATNGQPIFDPQAHIKLQPTQLTGKVTRQDNNQAIAGAMIKLRGSSIQTVTDKEGKYLFSELPASTQTLEVTARGFATATKTPTFTAGQQITINFQLA